MLLFNYILKRLLLRAFLLIPIFTLIYLAFDLSTRGPSTIEKGGFLSLIGVVFLRMPMIWVQIMPAVVMIAVLLTCSAMRRSGELFALALHGASPRCLWRPVLMMGLLATLGTAFLDEMVVPRSEQYADTLDPRSTSALTGIKIEQSWWRIGDCFLHYPLSSRIKEHDLTQSKKITVIRVEEPFAARERIDVDIKEISRGVLKKRKVTRFFSDGNWRQGGSSEKKFSTAAFEEMKNLKEWGGVRAEALSVKTLYQKVHKLALLGQTSLLDQLVLHTKIAFPLYNLIAALLAFPFALGLKRNSQVMDWIRLFLLVFMLWAFLALGWTLGRTLWLSPGGAIWLPTLCAGLIGIIRLKRALARVE